MAKFKFRLARVLKYRELLKAQAERELAENTHALTHAEKLQEQLIDEKDREKMPPDSILTAGDLTTIGEYEGFLEYLIDRQEGVIQEAEIAVENSREHLIEKAKEEKALSLLKEKKLEAFKEDLKVRDKKQVSEVALRQHRARQSTKEE